jgi:hypothetical protein
MSAITDGTPPPAEEAEGKMATVERIYIGGLDPPRLTAEDILGRLKRLTTVQIESVETSASSPDNNPNHKEKTYCHITAVSKEGVGESALAIISKAYNNVKWKGCRIAVEAAQPHFLQKLEQERRERQQQKELEKTKAKEEQEQPPPEEAAVVTPITQVVQDDEPSSTTPHNNNIPRRLRVRKKFGDEAFHVDTKPWSVDNWSHFAKARDKLERQGKNHAEKMLVKAESKYSTVAPEPLMHRAVHIRFEDDPEKEKRRAARTNFKDDVRMEEEFESRRGLEEASEDASSVSSASENEEETKGATSTKPSYVWSDDEDDDSDDDADCKLSVSEEIEPELVQDRPVNDDRDAGVAGDDKAPKSETKEHHWSSDEGNDDESERLMRDRPLQPVTETDEFAAGLDMSMFDDDDDDEMDEGDEQEEKDSGERVEPSGLEFANDVSANLNVLSSLFPEMAATKPAILDEEGSDEEALAKKAEREKKTSGSGFSSGGIMLRYDPNDVSTQKFEISEDEADSKDQLDDQGERKDEDGLQGDEDEVGSKSDDDEEEDELDDGAKDPKNAEKELSNVYEQGKLEDVFRDARNAWQGNVQPIAKKETSDTGGGAFSFGFELEEPASNKDPQTAKDEDSGGFSFSFSLPGQEAHKENATTAEIENPGEQDMDLEAVETKKKVAEKRRRGIHFPVDTLEKYQSGFFACNEGDRIMQDVEGFRKDEVEREEWQKERQTLTLDWRNKRKHAQSRIQKRMKIR